MTTISRTPSHEHLSRSVSPAPLESQVGGHPGVMTSEDGSLIMKPALPVEVAFYQAVLTDPALDAMRPYIPKFYGTLRLEGQVDEEQSAFGQIAIKQESATAVKDEEKESIVLENLSHAFAKPNILDIKLGTVLYDEDASAEKRQRMEKTARATTSFEAGIRLTGFQVYDTEQNVPVKIPKAYGRALKSADLPDGIAKFFPLATSKGGAAAPSHLTVPAVSADAGQGTGLPADVLLPILESLRDDVAEIRDVLSGVHVRMVGASLLIVYEADVERAREGVRVWLQGEGDEEEEDEDDEDEDEEDGKKRPGPPYAVKIIDFAHTRLKPGQGPDEGVLKGLDTVLRLLDGRIEQVKASQQDSA
ncbi:inositol polyphosphate kinase family protein [Phanerochaete sordida]|uniref:Kinase n=1 Tax=Phanerochaete sordida TaxID=48140 RepID=A0A9P3LAE7_9APHY|nr:inositol polyphosphate kinase family protein [Phanerochaete sordida]